MSTAAPMIAQMADAFNATLAHATAYIALFPAHLPRIPLSATVARYIRDSYQNDPFRILLELCLVFFTLRYLLAKKYRLGSENGRVKLTKQEVDMLVSEWRPEPLVPETDPVNSAFIDKVPVFKGPQGSRATLVDGREVANLGSYNFLGLLSDKRIHDNAVKTLREYGVGSCGPCGFYGTIDVHMELEQRLASFLGTESAIVYSQNLSTVSSVIPAFSKRGDIIVCDEAVNFAAQRGIQLSRSVIKYYRHNDMTDLERILRQVAADDVRTKRKLTRRFIVSEGLSAYHGDIAPLPQLIELKKKYKYRLILDDSHAFGVLGDHGAGTPEHFNIPGKEIDIYMGSLANALCASGGFCAGALEITDHQRLGGSAYVFSASLPAILARAAIDGIDYLQGTECVDTLARLRANVNAFRRGFGLVPGLVLTGDESSSPIMHLRINAAMLFDDNQRDDELASSDRALIRRQLDILMQTVVDRMLKDHSVVVVRAKYVAEHEHRIPEPSIRIQVTADFTPEEMVEMGRQLSRVASEELLDLGDN